MISVLVAGGAGIVGSRIVHVDPTSQDPTSCGQGGVPPRARNLAARIIAVYVLHR